MKPPMIPSVRNDCYFFCTEQPVLQHRTYIILPQFLVVLCCLPLRADLCLTFQYSPLPHLLTPGHNVVPCACSKCSIGDYSSGFVRKVDDQSSFFILDIINQPRPL